MSFTTFDRADWLRRALGDVAPLIMHMREQVVPSLQGSTEPRVSGSKEQTTVPLNLAPIDEADALWGMVCALVVDFVGRQGAWREMPGAIDRQWLIATSAEFAVVGFGSSDPERIYADVVEVTRYLVQRAFTLAVSREYEAPVDELVAHINAVRARYPGAAAPRHHRHRCPRCLRHGVVPTYSASGELEGLQCERCGATKQF